jgi:hypothetical protein
MPAEKSFFFSPSIAKHLFFAKYGVLSQYTGYHGYHSLRETHPKCKAVECHRIYPGIKRWLNVVIINWLPPSQQAPGSDANAGCVFHGMVGQEVGVSGRAPMCAQGLRQRRQMVSEHHAPLGRIETYL